MKLTPQAMLKYVEELANKYEELSSKEVAVGIIADKATSEVYASGKTVIELAAIHEFGAGDMPKRSFIIDSNEIKKKEIAKRIDEGLKKVTNPDGSSVSRELAFIGIFVQDIYKEAFVTRGFGAWPDITQATKDNKGSSQVLIDTGTLRRSINHEVRSKI